MNIQKIAPKGHYYLYSISSVCHKFVSGEFQLLSSLVAVVASNGSASFTPSWPSNTLSNSCSFLIHAFVFTRFSRSNSSSNSALSSRDHINRFFSPCTSALGSPVENSYCSGTGATSYCCTFPPPTISGPLVGFIVPFSVW